MRLKGESFRSTPEMVGLFFGSVSVVLAACARFFAGEKLQFLISDQSAIVLALGHGSFWVSLVFNLLGLSRKSGHRWSAVGFGTTAFAILIWL